MDGEKLHRFFGSVHSVFLKGDLKDFAKFVAFPMVIYSIGGVIVIRTAGELVPVLQGYRDAFADKGATSVTFEIEGHDEPKNQRMRVVINNTYDLADKAAALRSRVRFFLILDGDEFRIEMMEYLEAPFPLSDIGRIIH